MVSDFVAAPRHSMPLLLGAAARTSYKIPEEVRNHGRLSIVASMNQ
jgi:hypothetical protein